MKTLTRTELERSLREGLRPLYLLLGPEIYLRRVAAQTITDLALSRTLLREFNESSFSLLSDPVQADSVIDVIQALSGGSIQQ